MIQTVPSLLCNRSVHSKTSGSHFFCPLCGYVFVDLLCCGHHFPHRSPANYSFPRFNKSASIISNMKEQKNDTNYQPVTLICNDAFFFTSSLWIIQRHLMEEDKSSAWVNGLWKTAEVPSRHHSHFALPRCGANIGVHQASGYPGSDCTLGRQDWRGPRASEG